MKPLAQQDAIWTMMIRRIQASDWPSIARIQAESYPHEVLESLESLQSHWYVSESTCLVGEVQGDVVGYILAHPWIKGKIPPLNEIYSSLPANCDSLFIHYLALSPAFRGTGIGDELVQAVFEAGSVLGLTHFSLISVQGSEGFWKRFGFKKISSPPTDEYVIAAKRFYPASDFALMERTRETEEKSK